MSDTRDSLSRIFEKNIILFAFVGNHLAGDDVAALITYELICERYKINKQLRYFDISSSIFNKKFRLVNVGVNLENIYFHAEELQPELIVVIDICNIESVDYDFIVISPESLVDCEVSTHKLPLNLIINLINSEAETAFEIICISFDSTTPSLDVQDSVYCKCSHLADELCFFLQRYSA